MERFMKQAFCIVLFCGFCCVFSNKGYAQTKEDSLKAQEIFDKGVSLNNQKPDSSIIYLKEAYILFQKAKMNENLVYTLLAITNTYITLDRFDSARHYSNIAKAEARAKLDSLHPNIFLSLYNYANVLFFEGRYDHAITEYQGLIDRIVQLPDSIQEAPYIQICYFYSHNQLAICYDYFGDFEESQRYRQRLLRLYQTHREPSDRNIAIVHTTQASSYIDQNKFRSGLNALKRCLDVLDLNDPQLYVSDYVDTYFKIAKCYTELGKLDSAAFFLDKADAIQPAKNPRRPQVGLVRRGELAMRGDQYTEAISYLAAAQDQWAAVFQIKHRVFVKLFEQMGDAYAGQEDYPNAFQYYQQALAANHETMTGDETPEYFPPINDLQYPIPSISILAKKAKAFINHHGGSAEGRALAQACFLRVDSLFGRTLRELRSAESRSFFSKEFRPIYERAIDNCYTLYEQTGDEQHLAQAFAYSERSKAILLSLALRDSKARIEGGLPAAVLDEELELRTDIAAYRKRIFEAKPTTDSLLVVEWRNKLFDLEEAFRKLVEKMERDYPNYYQLKYGLVTTTPKQIQASLGSKKHQLIAYFQGDSTLYQFVFSKNNSQFYRQSFGESEKKHFSALLELLHTPGANDQATFAHHAKALYWVLFPASFDAATTAHLSVIPDGQLGFLPFGVLLTEAVNPGDGFRDLPYLLKTTQINYGYSATLLTTDSKQARSFTQELSAFAPAYQGALALSTNQPQAEAIAEQMGGTAYVDSIATEELFHHAAANSRILHLAMHGIPDVAHSLYAYLLFGPSNNDKEDGKLHAYELYNLSLNTELVTLSACETGYGKLAVGEGVMSLARAFRYAGCQNVLFSHWKVDGRSANDLLTGFYAAIANGAKPSEAIWQAKKDFLATAPPDQVHPYYWANFVLNGENQAVANSWPVSVVFLGVFLLLMLLAASLFFAFSKKNKKSV